MDLSSLFSLIVAIKPLETWEKPKRHKIVSLWPTCKKAYCIELRILSTECLEESGLKLIINVKVLQ